MHDHGVAIRPVHRLLCGVGTQAVDGFVDAAHASFDIQTLSFDETDRHEVEKVFLSEIKKGADKQVIGVALHNHPAFYVLQVKEDIAEDAFSQSTPEPLKKLDVTVATQLVLKGILGLDGAALDEEERVVYSSRADKALKAVHEGKCPIALILNPTKLDQIREVSDAGLVMPRKSTYFYPKVMTGLVINRLD
jgi:uncharacterized protein (DUF1015 family)